MSKFLPWIQASVLAVMLYTLSGCAPQTPDLYSHKGTQYQTFKKTWKSKKQGSLEHKLSDLGFFPYGGTVDDIRKAKVIVLGDIHRSSGKELSTALEAIISEVGYNPRDRLLIEMPSDHHWDLREDDEGRKTILSKEGDDNGESIIPFARRKSKHIYGFDADGVKKLRTDLGFQRNALTFISRNGNDKDLHPFLNWLIYDDMKIAKKDDAKDKVMRFVLDHRRDALYRSEKLFKIRDQVISSNIINKSAEAPAKVYVQVGAYHLAHIAPDLALAGIKNIVLDINENIEYSGAPMQKNLGLSQEGLVMFRYWRSRVTRYIESRTNQGSPPYNGPVDDFVKNLVKDMGESR